MIEGSFSGFVGHSLLDSDLGGVTDAQGVVVASGDEGDGGPIVDEAMLLDHANDGVDVLTAARRADRDQGSGGVDAQALLVEDG